MANANIMSLVEKYAKEYGVPYNIARATVGVESNYGSNDTSMPNEAGAIGPMQVTDWNEKSQRYFGEVLPTDSTEANVKIGMKELAEDYKAAKGDPRLTYLAYHNGIHGMQDIVAGERQMGPQTRAAMSRFDQLGGTSATDSVPLTAATFASDTGNAPITDAVATATGRTGLPDWINSVNSYSGILRESLDKENNILKARANDERLNAAYEKNIKAAEELPGKYEALTKRAHEGVEAYEQSLKPYEPPKETSPWETFSSLGMTLMLLGAAFTKQPAMNSIIAMNGLMQAVKMKDKEAVERYDKEWEGNMKVAKARYEAQKTEIHDAMEMLKTEPEMGRALLTAYGAKYQDQLTEQHAMTGNYAAIVQNYEKMGDILNKMEDHRIRASKEARDAFDWNKRTSDTEQLAIIDQEKATEMAISQGLIKNKDEFMNLPKEKRFALLREATKQRETDEANTVSSTDYARADQALTELAKSDPKYQSYATMAPAQKRIAQLQWLHDEEKKGKAGAGYTSHTWKNEVLEARAAAYAIEHNVSIEEARIAVDKEATIEKLEAVKPGSPQAARIAMEKAYIKQGMDPNKATIAASKNYQMQSGNRLKAEQLGGEYKLAIKHIDKLINILEKNTAVVGAAGRYLGKPLEFLFNITDLSKSTARADYTQALDLLKDNVHKLSALQAGEDSASVQKMESSILPGFSLGTTRENALSRLKALREDYTQLNGVLVEFMQGKAEIAPIEENKPDTSKVVPQDYGTILEGLRSGKPGQKK